jgi:hypothetical protein
MRWVGRERVNLGVATPHLPTAGLLELADIADRFGAILRIRWGPQ